jgi:hypothetical protein
MAVWYLLPGFSLSSYGPADLIFVREQALTQLAGALLEALFAAPGNVPDSFRDLFSSLQADVLQRFPEMKERVVGGFFFLRFICPALVSPEQWGLLDGTYEPAAHFPWQPVFS